MNPSLIEDLRCPLSSDALQLEGDDLVCPGCRRRWEIRDGVPRLVPPDLVEQQRRTAAAFGFEWQHFAEQHAGCGTGRHSYYAAKYGASEVVGLDLSEAVETARRVLEPFENAAVVQGDLLRPPFRTAAEGGGFDLVYSIGVLHHLPDPQAGFRSLLRFVRPGGTIAVWVYGHENNGFVRNVVEPLRQVSTKVPPPLLRGAAWPLGAAFHGLAKGVYRPLAGTTAGASLPLNEYMASVADFSFRQNYSIVFDQLVAPTAAYIRETEIRGWFEESGLEDVAISHRHRNSWRGKGRVPDSG